MTGRQPETDAGRSGRRWSRRAVASIVTMVVSGFLGLLVWAILKPSSGNGLAAEIAQGRAPAAPPFDLKAIWPKKQAWPRELKAGLADGRLAASDLRGRPVVLNMWASWCIPCRDEAPILNASARAHAGEVTFIGIDVRDLTADAVDFLREFDVPYVSVRDNADQVFPTYDLTGVPETYFLDRTGRIIAHIPGPVTPETLEAGIRQAVEANPAR